MRELAASYKNAYAFLALMSIPCMTILLVYVWLTGNMKFVLIDSLTPSQIQSEREFFMSLAQAENPTIIPNNIEDPIKEESQESDNDEQQIIMTWQKTRSMSAIAEAAEKIEKGDSMDELLI